MSVSFPGCLGERTRGGDPESTLGSHGAKTRHRVLDSAVGLWKDIVKRLAPRFSSARSRAGSTDSREFACRNP